MPNASQPAAAALPAEELNRIHAWWRATDYLAVEQIYLLDNPLLREPLTNAHIKPRLLGHWGTTPGINFVYAHLNRIIIARDRAVLAIIGPGHGGPALVASTCLEGSYSELYPDVGRDIDGKRQLFRQFTFPGGIPSHCAPDVPGSVNEGGELGYSLANAFGAAFDNPDLLVACIVGDGEAETGSLATAWRSNKFLNPATDGAVLPILHLNGYKIANPTILARIPRDELASLLTGYGWEPFFVAGDEPEAMHQLMAGTLDRIMDRIESIQSAARARPREVTRLRWPMIVLQSPKGWPGRRKLMVCRSRAPGCAHQVPLAQLATNPAHLAMLEQWLRSYRPATLRCRRITGGAAAQCGPQRHATHGFNSACQRRTVVAGSAAAAAGKARRAGSSIPGPTRAKPPACSAPTCVICSGSTSAGATSACGDRTRRPGRCV